MNKLKAELERKRKALDSAAAAEGGGATSGSQSDDQPPAPKYMKRADYERLRDASRSPAAMPLSGPSASTSTPQADRAAQELGAASQVPADEDPRLHHTGQHQQQQPPEVEDEVDQKFNVSNEECVLRLRAKGQPIRLFAESDKDRRSRLRALELMDAHAAGSGVGQRNDLMRALEDMDRGEMLDQLASKGKVDEAVLSKLQQSSQQQQQQQQQGNSKNGQDNGKGKGSQDKADEDGEEAGANKDKVREDGETPVDVSLAKGNPYKLYPQIYFALKKVLREWEAYMSERPDTVKRSTQGKLAAATQKQSADYLKPLFKSLRKRELEYDVLVLIAEIAYRMQTREYLKANDAYLKLSIGNAPWPIGVTMVGIHERSARSKLHVGEKGHVLNDETSRKYIQSLKRLLTFAQTRFPPDDPSQLMG